MPILPQGQFQATCQHVPFGVHTFEIRDMVENRDKDKERLPRKLEAVTRPYNDEYRKIIQEDKMI